MEEIVGLLDDDGRVCGSAPRPVVRRDNLRHGATGVLVRNSAGDIYVHRRTTTKDVYPGRYDVMAGGVIAFGEAPYDAAVRELAEELGITGVELTPLPEGDYADEHTSYRAYLYACEWDGPIRHQPEEIDWGGWLAPAEVLDRLDDPAWPFVPDSSALLVPLLRTLATLTDEGWDSRAWTDGRWLYRDPRRPQVRPQLLAEARLLPWLAPQLPLPIPEPELTATGVRHRLLMGEPIDGANPDLGTELGRFLTALHAVDADAAVRHGALDQRTADTERAEVVARMRSSVLPRVPDTLQSAAAELLDLLGPPAPRAALIHADLGPEHILVTGGRITGVIDWSDCRIGDPALDLSWLLYGAPNPLAAALVSTYGIDRELRDRAGAWHRLAPWYQALRGVDIDRPAELEAGLAGITARLVTDRVRDVVARKRSHRTGRLSS